VKKGPAIAMPGGRESTVFQSEQECMSEIGVCWEGEINRVRRSSTDGRTHVLSSGLPGHFRRNT